MPPKGWGKGESSEDESSTESTETESTEESTDESSEEEEFTPAGGSGVAGAKPGPKPAPKPAPKAATGVVANKPHDEEFDADDGPAPAKQPPAKAPAGKGPSGAGGVVANRPHDVEMEVNEEHRHTPPGRGGPPAPAPAKAPPSKAPAAKAPVSGANRGTIANDHADEFEDVENDVDEDDDVPTPPKPGAKPTAKPSAAPQARPGAAPVGGSRQLSNQPHDVEFEADGGSVGSPSSSGGGLSPPTNHKAPPAATAGKAPQGKMSMKPQSDDESSEESSSDDDGDASPGSSGGNNFGSNNMYSGPSVPVGATAQPLGQAVQSVATIPEYNPADYAHVVKKQSAEVRDLFNHITAYQPQIVECPTKLKPFIPDLLPCVGDIDTFCKIPRPDGKPDNLGLTVVDEPCSNQSNPAVVKMSLLSFAKVRGDLTFVDSVEDASNRPKVIDKWIADIKAMQHKKPLPTVTYSKPMPDIERLMQAWPPEFEELLNSDVALPPPTIDLDMYQYAKLLCSILDIPTYANPIESLHVMFTLYLEFRANQHFQHA